MAKTKIIGAGSIGNHLAYACRNLNWEVTICDTDPTALKRTKEEIYPERYGSWDDAIRLSNPKQVQSERFDVVIIGTPPDIHIPLAIQELESTRPRALLIEKPLCGPEMEGCDELVAKAKASETFVAVGYNHRLTHNTYLANDLINQSLLDEVFTVNVNWIEHWSGIFRAHPWLDGPGDSYLGYSKRGGGACCEHSHGINIWQYFAQLLGVGRIVEVLAMADIVEDGNAQYDRITQIHCKTELGLVGTIVQDVVSDPGEKRLHIQGSKGSIDWYVNRSEGQDAVTYQAVGRKPEQHFIAKKRPDDFSGEIDHIAAVLEGNLNNESPISLDKGLETVLVIAAADLSSKTGRCVSIDYSVGYNSRALRTVS